MGNSPSPPHLTAVSEFLRRGGLNRNPSPGVGRHFDVLNSSTMPACQICSLFCAFQNESSECTITSLSDPRGALRILYILYMLNIILSRAHYCLSGLRYPPPLTLHDCIFDIAVGVEILQQARRAPRRHRFWSRSCCRPPSCRG